MQHALQLEICDQLLQMVHNKTTCDAGQQLRNPTSAYVDEDLAKREWQTFFLEHPQLIGLSGDLPEPGSFFTFDDLGIPLLASRDENGAFHVFVNACRHRGVQVVESARGCSKRLTCPFHGWTYSTDGKLRGVTEAGQFGSVSKDRMGLLELPSVEQYGMLWMHPQADGEINLGELLGDLAAELASWEMGTRVYRGGRILDKPMNWKLANDTFGETYHFSRLHRDTLGQLFHGDALAYETMGRNHRAVFPARGISKLEHKPREQWRLDHVATVLYYLFPNIQITMSERQITLFRIYPERSNPRQSRTHMSHYFSEQALALINSGNKTVIDPETIYDRNARDGNAIISPEGAMEVLDSTVEHEDFRMSEATQRAAESGHLAEVIFGRNEAPLQHFHQTFREALELPPLEMV